ncbi:MAG: hypothetical protein HY789_00605, partial [Deltaproteobacteria bacterium]|nr:hypothetical protein [Deltaproteobacteria bacterium]
MRIKKLLLLGLLITIALSGCMSAQYLRDRRIAENVELFNSYSPDIQEQIRLGQVNLGFSEDMVGLAWGPPDRMYVRTTERGEETVWIYSSRRLLTQTDRMSVPVRVYDDRGRSTIVYRNIW